MGLRKYLKGALCGIVSGLAGCMPRYAESNIKQLVSIEQELKKPVESVPAEPRKLKLWQYPVNVIGGHFTSLFVHESAHAVVGMIGGAKVNEFHIFPGVNRIGRYCIGWVDFENWEELSPQEMSLMYIAGPVSDVLLSEAINYNLRKGKVSKKYQPFWATTSLLSRLALINNSINSFKEEGSDISYFSDVSGIPKEVPAGLIGLYTALSAKRIAKEFRVALGKDSYDYKPRKGEINLLPTNDGISVSYSLNF